MTKKQIAAMGNIIALENAQCEDWKLKTKPGIHPAWDKWIVTDGISAVLLNEKPDDLPEGDEMQQIYNLVEHEIKEADAFLSCIATSEKIKEWKALAKPWKKGKDIKTGAVPVEITVNTNDGHTISAHFNPWYLVNVVESVGTNAMLYIGRECQFNKRPALFVYPKDWMEYAPDAIGFLLPIRG